MNGEGRVENHNWYPCILLGVRRNYRVEEEEEEEIKSSETGWAERWTRTEKKVDEGKGLFSLFLRERDRIWRRIKKKGLGAKQNTRSH